jgi:hypothetical protein
MTLIPSYLWTFSYILPPNALNDVFAVSDPSIVLKDTRCTSAICDAWSVQLATRPNLSIEDKTGAFSLTTPSGEEHQFAGTVDVARWATATAFEKRDTGSAAVTREKRIEVPRTEANGEGKASRLP